MTYKETFAWKAVSVATAIATIVTLSGVVYLTQVFNVFAAGEEAVVEDITGVDPRIAPNGESERVFLGINIVQDADGTSTLDEMNITLSSDDSAAEAAVSNIETVRVYRDSALAGTNGVFDSSDALIKTVTRTETAGASTTVAADTAAGNGAGDSCVDATATAGIIAGDAIKIGTGVTAEVREVAVVNALDCDGGAGASFDTTTVLTYTHAPAEVIRELADMEVTTDEGFQIVSAGTITVELETLAYTIADNDAGTNAGNDLFVVLLTADGLANQTVKAQIFTGDLDSSVAGADDVAVSSASGTTDGTTKTVTMGADGTAPTIDKVESSDTNNDGIVDRFTVYFSESMASSGTSTANFKDATGGTASRINSLDASTTDLELGSITWKTTTVLNDTAQFDVSNTGAYTSRANSTGDTWTVIYDEDDSNDLTDATGEELTDASVTSTDMAKPAYVSSTIHDLDGDGQVDELRVRWSETLGGGSTVAGAALKSTSVSPNRVYTISGVNGFSTATGSDNQNDIIKLAVTESGQLDVNDTFSFTYTAQTGAAGVLDVAGNNAQAKTGVAPTLAANPVVTKVVYKDNGDGTGAANNGKIDSVEVTFTCSLTEGGTAENDMVVAGYTIEDGGAVGAVWTSAIEEGSVVDGDTTPEFTYTEDGDADLLHCGDANEPLQNVASGDVMEEDDVDPVLSTVTLYETNANDIWEAGETLQLFFLEPVDAATVASSWNVTGATGATAWTDWRLESANNTAATDAEVPDAGTISVSGRVVNLVASSSATSALGTGDKLSIVPNEVKDPAGNSAFPMWDATAYATDAVALVVTPTSAPTVDDVRVMDLNGNGVVDALYVFFNGMVDASTVVSSDWAAARGANFTIANAVGEAATSTAAVTPDLTVTSVSTLSGGNDSVVVVKFAESNENTGTHPQVKYVQGSLADLGGNKTATFNAFSSDNSKFETTITNDAKDYARPVVVHKLLKDRNNNGKYDQLVLVFSEGIDNDTTPANALAAATHSATGWSVTGETLAANGTLSSNDGAYDAYTFASTNAVFSVDIIESDAPTQVPSVTYSSTGNFVDKYGHAVLGDVAAGGEVSEINVAAAPMFADGDLVREAGSFDIYIVSHPGVKKFKRLILNPAIFESYGHLEWANVQDVAAGTLNAYTVSDLVMEVNPDGSAVNGRVYKVSSAAGADTGTKQHLNMSASMFESCGYDWDAIAKINHTEASDSFYPVGAAITSC